MKKSAFIKLILLSSLSSCAVDNEMTYRNRPFPTQAAVPDTLSHDSIPESYATIHEVYHTYYVNHYSYAYYDYYNYGGGAHSGYYYHGHASQGKPANNFHTTSHSGPRTSRSGFGTMAVSAVS